MEEGTRAYLGYKRDLRPLQRYTRVVRRQLGVIVAALVLAVLAAAAVSWTQSPTYRASMQVVVGQGNSFFQPQFGSSVQPFTQTMTRLLESDIVASTAIRQLGLALTPKALLSRIHVSTDPESSVLAVSYDAPSKDEAVRTLAGIGAAFTRVVRTRLGFAPGSGAPSQPPITARVFDPPHALSSPVAPRKTRNLLLAVVIGILLGLVLAFARESFDGRIRSADEAEEAFGAPVVGVLAAPGRKRLRRSRQPAFSWHDPLVVEAADMLRARIAFRREGGDRTIAVTSPFATRARSVVAAALATSLAAGGRSVVCVDADVDRGELTRMLGLDGSERGFADALSSHEGVEPRVATVTVPGAAAWRSPTQDVSFHVLTAGDGGGIPELDRDAVRRVVGALHHHYSYVIVDAPPILSSPDAFPLLLEASSVVVTLEQGRSTKETAGATASMLADLGLEPLLVLTGPLAESSGGGRSSSRAGATRERDRPRSAGSVAPRESS